MPTECELALEALADESAPFEERLFAYLSGPTREEEERFASCWAKLSDARRRQMAAQLVASAAKSFELDFVALFRRCLRDSDPAVRQSAIEGLWEDERPDLVRPLLWLLTSDPSAAVRAAAAASLGRFVYLAECDALRPELAEAVRTALHETAESPSEDIEVVRRAVESLAYINDEAVRRLIDRTYEHSDPRMRQSAVFAMGRSADRLWAEIVLEEVRSPLPAMRREAARACGEMELQRAVEPLAELVEDLDREVQGVAVWALGQIGGKRARQVLERCLQSEDATLAEEASEALDNLSFGTRSFDLFVHELDAKELADLHLDDAEEADQEDLADQTVDDTDWPDEFLEID